VAQAQAELPLECCGLLAGTITENGNGQVFQRYPLINAAASPVEYLSEPRSMFAACKDMRRRGLVEVAVYHSHPTSVPIPSKKDLSQSYGAGVINFIISLLTEPPTVCGWWLLADSYEPAEWNLIEEAQGGCQEPAGG
jgi:proteasome lid subunit RPN8/RPN11